MKSIHLIAPSGASLDVKSPLAGIDWLKKQGIAIQNAESTQRVHERFAGTDIDRLNELNELTKLDSKTLVMAMRGGYGIHRLLPNIDWQGIAKAIQSGLQICGHSDFTAFHLGLLAKTGAVSLSGPMLNFDFGQFDESGSVTTPDQFMWEHFTSAIDNQTLDCSVSAPQTFLGKKSLGTLSGLLWGGNLTVLTSLIGTEYLPDQKKTQSGILFLEDVNEHPYRIERMLIQLLEAGVLNNQAAVLLGGFSAYRLYDNDKGYSLESAIRALRQRLPNNIPLLTELPFGHQPNKLTLPVGAITKLNYSPDGFSLSANW